jgi:cytochrome c oxidase cbb3-type subunit III
MKSWEDDYSPMQIAQIASYVKSLGGTKPAKPKEPQGTLYQEGPTSPVADSAKTDKKVTAAN